MYNYLFYNHNCIDKFKNVIDLLLWIKRISQINVSVSVKRMYIYNNLFKKKSNPIKY